MIPMGTVPGGRSPGETWQNGMIRERFRHDPGICWIIESEGRPREFAQPDRHLRDLRGKDPIYDHVRKQIARASINRPR
jgi:hypothetical protein